jgi:hypothetical protein
MHILALPTHEDAQIKGITPKIIGRTVHIK